MALDGRDVQNLPKYYRDYAIAGKSLLTPAKPLQTLYQKRPRESQVVTDWLKRSGRDEGGVVWLPLQARKEDLVVVLDAATAQPLQAFAIDPW